MPLQGSASDIMKIAMIRLDEELARSELRAKLILQVHDELVLEVDRPDVRGGRRAGAERDGRSGRAFGAARDRGLRRSKLGRTDTIAEVAVHA